MRYRNDKTARLDKNFLKVGDILATVSGIIMIGMMTILFVDVVMSKLFNQSVPRQMELVTYFHVPVVYLALLAVQLSEGHATVDLLYDKFSPKMQMAFDIVWNILGVGICGFETYTSLLFTIEKLTLNTLSNTKNGFVIWPFCAAMCLGWFLMGLSYIWCIIRRFHRESGSEKAETSGKEAQS